MDAIVTEAQLVAELGAAVQSLQEKEENLTGLKRKERLLAVQDADGVNGPSEVELEQQIEEIDAEICELQERIQKHEGVARAERSAVGDEGAHTRWGELFTSQATKTEPAPPANLHRVAPIRRRGFGGVGSHEMRSEGQLLMGPSDRPAAAFAKSFQSRASALIPLAATPSGH